jgi:subtilisin family serine protease
MAIVMPARATPSTPWAIAPSALPNHVPEVILVKPKRDVAEQEVQALFTNHGAAQVGAIEKIDIRILHIPEAHLEAVLAAMQKNPNLEFAEPDYLVEPDLVPNDTYYPSQWHLQKVQAPQAWDLTTGSNTITIAILDTGVEPTHPDLAGKLVSGWNFYDNNSDTSDQLGHGTAVAGAAAAISDNTNGVASLAWGCLIMPIRITDTNGNTALSTIATALSWAADHGARVANLSYSVSWSSTVKSAAQYFMSKGGLTTISSGNDGKFYTWADNPYVLTVTATDSTDVITTWSTTGDNIDICAPGVNVLTTATGGRYGNASGTSFSAPIVAGVAALVLSINPSLTGTQLRTLLEQSADDLGPVGWDTGYGYGRVNAYKAVLAAGGNPADTTPPTVSLNSPTNGSIVSATITARANANDNVGVAKVELYLDGALAGSSASASPTFSWDTTNSTNGTHILWAKAYDAAGNSGTSTSVTVTVQNPGLDITPPAVSVSAPLEGATVSGLTSVTVNASDNVGVTRIEWYLDGGLAGSTTTVPASFSWKTTGSTNGSHSIQAKAYDAAGNVGVSSLVTVTVQNALKAPPASRITSPSAGAAISAKSTKVYVAATDGVGVTRVDLIVDGTLYSSNVDSTPTPNWNTIFNWNTSRLAKGSHTLQSIAYDAAGQTGNSTLVTIYK